MSFQFFIFLAKFIANFAKMPNPDFENKRHVLLELRYLKDKIITIHVLRQNPNNFPPKIISIISISKIFVWFPTGG